MSDDQKRSDASKNQNQPFDPAKAAEKKGHWRPRVLVHKLGEEQPSEELVKRNATWGEVAGTFSTEDFAPSRLVRLPCVRESFLPGIGGGAAIGALRFLTGASTFSCYNWAIGSCFATATVLYQVCQRRRQKDKEGIKQVIKVIEEKEALKGVEKKIEAAEARRNLDARPPGPVRPALDQKTSFWGSFKFW